MKKMKNRDYNLDLMRTVAIIMIIVSHCYSILDISKPYIISIYDDLGRWGVLIFLLISGYLVSTSQTKLNFTFKEHIKNFIKKIKSFYPLYLITTLIMVVIFLYYLQFDMLIKRLICHIFLLQSFIPVDVNKFAYTLNTPAWYLSMMIFCWIVTPMQIYIYKKSHNKILLFIIVYIILGIILYINYCIFMQYDSSILRYYMYVNPIVNCLIYFIGMLSIKDISNKFQKFELFNYIFIILAIIAYINKNILPVDWRVYGLIVPSVLMISALIALSKNNYGIKKEYHFLEMGQESLILMLTHFPICYVMREKFADRGVIYFLLTLFMVYIFYKLMKYLRICLRRRICI